MDRLPHDLVRENGDGHRFDMPAMSVVSDDEFMLRQSMERMALPERLFALDELDVHYDREQRALWTFMRPRHRPSFTPAMLADFEQWQSLIVQGFGPQRSPLDFLILGSRAPGVFCFGGDLQLFAELIRSGNRDGLIQYGNRCVDILDRNIRALDLPMLTIGLVQGQALGGGFESLLSFDFIIAERGSSFGLPETMFGLFPGMGAHPLLSRKLGTAMADRLILSDETYSAETMYELGIVHALAEPGEGIAAVRSFMAKSSRRHAGMVAARKAMRVSAPIPMQEFYSIVELWADAALQLSEKDLKLMLRLVSAQERLAKAS
jgi:DSF synthase